jgi:hypothetical protein
MKKLPRGALDLHRKVFRIFGFVPQLGVSSTLNFEVRLSVSIRNFSLQSDQTLILLPLSNNLFKFLKCLEFTRESKKLSALLFFQFIYTKVGVEQERHFST